MTSMDVVSDKSHCLENNDIYDSSGNRLSKLLNALCATRYKYKGKLVKKLRI